MPYILQEDRLTYDRIVAEIAKTPPRSPGNLNYLVTKLVLAYIGGRNDYGTYNAAIGALECAKLELYARQIRPFEDSKIALNGDVDA